MAREIILHIGHPKTGSTTIQRSIAQSRNALAENGILYPRTALIEHNHRVLGPDLFRENEMKSGLAVKMGNNEQEVFAASAAQWQSVTEQVANSDADRVLLSAESFFQELPHHHVGIVGSRLSAIRHDSLRILAYLRNPNSLYLSFLQQRLRGGRGFITPTNQWREKTLESWKRETGTAVEIREFHRDALKRRDALADFLDWENLPEQCVNRIDDDANVSVSAEAMSVLFRLGPPTPPATPQSLQNQRRLARAVKIHDSRMAGATKPQLQPQTADYLTSINKDLVYLKDHHGLRFRDCDYDLIGRDLSAYKPSNTDIEDIIDVDIDRRDALESVVIEELDHDSKFKS